MCHGSIIFVNVKTARKMKAASFRFGYKLRFFFLSKRSAAAPATNVKIHAGIPLQIQHILKMPVSGLTQNTK